MVLGNKRLLEGGPTWLKLFSSLSQVNLVCHRSIQVLIKLISFAGWVSAGWISLVIQPAALAGSTREKRSKAGRKRRERCPVYSVFRR